jgi:ACS family hexuronate transporter-like MFS transporter
MKLNGLRWWVIGLIAIATIINYLDRNTLSIMWSGMVGDLGLIDKTLPEAEAKLKAKEIYSYIYMFFMIAYGISQMVSGKLYDKIGTRLGFVVSIVVWAIADALTSLARGIGSLSFFRALLGLGEAGAWPGAAKSNAEWFPVKERALAQGIFNAGASVGAILSPVIIALLYSAFGWKSTFVIVGAIGLVWIIPWLIINKKLPKDHPWISEEEKKYILDGQPETKILNDKSKTWGELLRHRQSYAVIVTRFLIDPIWWMFVAWLPMYLFEVHGYDIKQIGFTAWVPYVGAMFGSISGGLVAKKLISMGKTVNYTRKATIIAGSVIMLPMLIATAFASQPIVAVILMAFILFGFQFAIGNIQTLPSDFFSGKTVGSLAGLGGAAATLGVILSMLAVPYLTRDGNWLWFFILGAMLVPLATGSVYLFGGKIGPVDSEQKR